MTIQKIFLYSKQFISKYSMRFYSTQDQFLRYIRKPPWIPSSFWIQKSFLEYFEESSYLPIQEIFHYQQQFFTKEQEYGLLNRLDNDTSGFLYLAKTPLFFDQYKTLQSQHKLEKTYIADVSGLRIPHKIIQQEWVSFDPIDANKIIISRGIAHHRYIKEKMLVTRSPKDRNKVWGKIHQVKTTVTLLYHEESTNISTLQITITTGIRHQIRVHLASLGYPIVWDKLYNKSLEATDRLLHLWSVGLKTI